MGKVYQLSMLHKKLLQLSGLKQQFIFLNQIFLYIRNSENAGMDNSWDPCGIDGGQWYYSVGKVFEAASLTSVMSWQGWLKVLFYLSNIRILGIKKL